LEAGKRLADSPIRLLDHVERVLKELSEHYPLIVATKGDLLDQERKLRKSGLEPYFHHIEIMSNKETSDYRKLLRHLDIEACEFLMIGNSLRSDIIPVIQLGGHAVHIPYHTTWLHEKIDAVKLPEERFMELPSIADIPGKCRWLRP
jgi:putative hydrolase of the HAD superfamily